MRVGHRLLITVLPGIIGVVSVSALAYWGERGRQVPAVFLAIAVAVTILSLWLAWTITRDFALRIERLNRLVDDGGKSGTDELAGMERLIDVRAETGRLLHDAGDRMAQRIDDIRMPLHVLLDTPFGELNENQEEMIGLARAAADVAVADAHQLRDLGALELAGGTRRDRLSAADLVRALQPTIEAEGRRRRVRVTFDIPPALPAIVGDRARLQEVVRRVLVRTVRASPEESTVAIALVVAPAEVRVSANSGGELAALDLTAERRLLEALGGSLQLWTASAEIGLPFWA